MENNVKQATIRDKAALIAFIAENPALISQGVAIIKKAISVVNEAKEFAKTVEQSEKNSLLFNLIKPKDKNSETEDTHHSYCSVSFNQEQKCILLSSPLSREIYSKFEKLNLSEKVLDNNSDYSEHISTVDFIKEQSSILETYSYTSKMEIPNYLGNKHIILKSNAVLVEQNNCLFLHFNTLLFNNKSKENYLEIAKIIPLNNFSFKEKIPTQIEHNISVSKNYDLLINFIIK